MQAKTKKDKDAIDLMFDQIDLHGMTKEELDGENGLPDQITKRFYEKVLEAEMDEHLGYAKHDNAGENSGNSRNGYTTKSVITKDNNTVEIEVPRDRNSTFEPVIIPKHEKGTPLFNNQIISMYSYGMSCREIQRHLKNVYEVDVSPCLHGRSYRIPGGCKGGIPRNAHTALYSAYGQKFSQVRNKQG